MTAQRQHRKFSSHLLLVSVAIALLAMVTAGGASAAGSIARKRSDIRCEDGEVVASKVVRRAGKRRRVFLCRRSPVVAPTTTTPVETPASTTPAAVPAPAATATTAAPATPTVTTPVESPVVTPPIESPAVTPPTTTPPVETPVTESPPVPTGDEPQVQASIRQGFEQNPLVPDEVTWHYSASAARTVSKDGVTKTEAAPIPPGRLVFYLNGKLECEVRVGGAISGSACTISLKRLGAQPIEAIYSGATSDTVARTDYVEKYPTSTSLQVSVEPTPPEYLDIGPNKYGFDQHAFEVGRLRVTGGTSPGGYPYFTCAGQAEGCLEPDFGLYGGRGSVSVPLYAENRWNSRQEDDWQVAFSAYSPYLREGGYFWQFPAESVGKKFLHAVSDPDPDLYVPSEITVPLDLNGGHYPYYHFFFNEQSKHELGGSATVLEGIPQKVADLGSYDKLGGTEQWLSYHADFSGVYEESAGCAYEIRVDGRSVERGTWEPDESGGLQLGDGVLVAPAGPHTFALWVERRAGTGTGKCSLQGGSFEAYERRHTE